MRRCKAREVTLEALKWNGHALQLAAAVLKADHDSKLEAVQQRGLALKLAAVERAVDRAVVLEL